MDTNINTINDNRNIKLDGTNNFRDLGGYIGYKGRRVKYRQLFRSDALHKLTDKDISWLEMIGLKTIVDFRSSSEIVDNEDKIIKKAKYYHLNPKAEVAQTASASLANDRNKIERLVKIANSDDGDSYFANHMDDMSEQMRRLISDDNAIKQYKKVMALIVDEQTPLVFHCRGGKDRTGIAALFILLALGVSKEQIYEDYLVTNSNNVERNKLRMNDYRSLTDNQKVLDYLYNLQLAKKEYLDAAFDQMIIMAGSTTGYLIDILEVTDEQLTELRIRYLD
ncbi:MAG: tyrosine-protein phosphatase [Erysipelotrichaceae bacterium]|nr:tyrosine-protein phosphatase [Erysipelotrichaceae bacterium]